MHATVDLSAILTAEITAKKQLFDERGITVLQNVEDGVTVVGDPAALERAIAEIVENAVAFSEEFAKFVLTKENGRVTMKASNKTQLKNGNVDIVFDRFATLENAEGKGRHGLGLSYVKDAIRAAGGRVRADVAGGVFTLKITL